MLIGDGMSPFAPPIDRRRDPRVRIAGEAVLRTTHAGPRGLAASHVRGRLLDVSPTGVCVRIPAPRRLHVGATVQVDLAIDAADLGAAAVEPVRLQGRGVVVRGVPVGRTHTDVALELESALTLYERFSLAVAWE
jgi:hypothetical protein